MARETIVENSNVIPPPYTPDFGQTPPTLAGRDGVIGAVSAALERGPKSPWFVRGFVGGRGVGKTAVLNRIEDTAASKGWPVVRLQVVANEPVIGTFLRTVIHAAGSRSSKMKKALKAIDVEVRAGLSIGVASAEVTAKRSAMSAPAPSDLVRRTLELVGRHAQESGLGVLITVDETQNWSDVQEVSAVAAALQLVVKRDQLPIAVYFAGLPSTRSVLRAAGTFFERMEIEDLDDLDEDSSMLALIKPASDAGFSYSPEALHLIVEKSKGYPYFLQLAGYHAWPVEPDVRRIELAAAQHGVTEAERVINAIFLERWENLTPLEKAYLWSVARHGGVATSAQLIKDLGRGLSQLATPRASLINDHRLLRPKERGVMELTLPGLGEWILQQPDVTIPQKRSRKKRS